MQKIRKIIQRGKITLEYRMRMKNKWITDGLEEREEDF